MGRDPRLEHDAAGTEIARDQRLALGVPAAFQHAGEIDRAGVAQRQDGLKRQRSDALGAAPGVERPCERDGEAAADEAARVAEPHGRPNSRRAAAVVRSAVSSSGSPRSSATRAAVTAM